MSEPTAPPTSINDLARHLAPHRDRLAEVARRVIESGWYVLGESVRGFEERFAEYTGAAGCVGVGTGTDALEIALRAVGVGPGDRVATVANAGGYSATAIRAIGARPEFVDVSPDDLLVDVELLGRALVDPPAAIVVTHLWGRGADMETIAHLAAEAGTPLIEDCAQAHGTRIAGRHVGTWGDLGCFSFYPTKNLGAIGDGGAVIGSEPRLLDRVRTLRQYGWEAKYRVTTPGGRNSRLDEIQAAFLHELLPHLESWNERRREISRLYATTITHPDVVVPERGGPGDVVHLFVVRSHDREGLRQHLSSRGIPTDVHYPIPDHHQAVGGQAVDLPVTEAAAREILTLPCFPEMTDDEVLLVAREVNAWVP